MARKMKWVPFLISVYTLFLPCAFESHRCMHAFTVPNLTSGVIDTCYGNEVLAAVPFPYSSARWPLLRDLYHRQLAALMVCNAVLQLYCCCNKEERFLACPRTVYNNVKFISTSTKLRMCQCSMITFIITNLYQNRNFIQLYSMIVDASIHSSKFQHYLVSFVNEVVLTSKVSEIHFLSGGIIISNIRPRLSIIPHDLK